MLRGQFSVHETYTDVGSLVVVIGSHIKLLMTLKPYSPCRGQNPRLGFDQVLVSPFGRGGGDQVQSSIRKDVVSSGCVGTLESSRTGLNSAPWFEYSSPEFHNGQLGMTILSACNKMDWPRTRLISARLSVTGECHAC